MTTNQISKLFSFLNHWYCPYLWLLRGPSPCRVSFWLTFHMSRCKDALSCSGHRLQPHIHELSEAQRCPSHVQRCPALSFTFWETSTFCLHGGGFVLVQSSLGLEYSLQLAGHVYFPVCDMHPVLINGDSKYKSRCAQHNESQRAISFSVLENSYFPLLGDLPSLWTGNRIGNRISQLKALFKSVPSLEGQWLNLQEPSAICCLFITHVGAVC